MNRQPQQVAVIPDVSTVGELVVSGARYFAKKHKVITGAYLFGILVLIIGGTGTKLTLDQQRQYKRIMNTIDLNAEYEASSRYGRTYEAYRASKGWFSCDSLCQRNKDRMEDAKRQLDAIRAEGYNRMSDAKATAGIFSEIGVGEVKDSFWGHFHSGKQFAKRQSMWDAMFMGIRSMGRDEGMAEYLLRVLMNVLINFSIGLVMALVFFMWGLWSIIKSYQPDPFTALLFFLTAVCAGFAFVASYLLIMYGAAAGGIYGMAKMAEGNLRIQGQQGGAGQRQRMQYNNRPHYE
mmetsp:Transcript_11521/g.14274  ORF Transcript_11521/g.14274 Transcript_11521/m.14274 type:complete len:292 (-) Transcript_11521:55-930(-)|eukprot:CAMPEP_0172499256 /NCGR_PEP_ID=MMETSP1066-20121228/124513_1 /TAXON_ID=671091 /ORGANISM="Coscinodiscus wailesii, Strain CCMP2513" /LENGTH=291 /DNA_ID=CAMNT_0013272893 /DNA_START=233 /DNA_END=1108 /DNA_ORIENTATION=+